MLMDLSQSWSGLGHDTGWMVIGILATRKCPYTASFLLSLLSTQNTQVFLGNSSVHTCQVQPLTEHKYSRLLLAGLNSKHYISANTIVIMLMGQNVSFNELRGHFAKSVDHAP